MQDDEYDALSDCLEGMDFLMPDVEEYKGDIPLPRFLSESECKAVKPSPAGGCRSDDDPVNDDDWNRRQLLMSRAKKRHEQNVYNDEDLYLINWFVGGDFHKHAENKKKKTMKCQ